MISSISFHAQMLTMKFRNVANFRLIFRVMLFLPPVVLAVWYLLGNVGAYAAGSTGLVAFGIFGYTGAVLMAFALIVMMADRAIRKNN